MLIITYPRLESNIFHADYFISFIMDVYISSCKVLRGSQGTCKWRGSTFWGNIPVALPLCHGRHHSHRLLIEWYARKVILMSKFIRDTMHAGLWCHRMLFFFSLGLIFLILFYLSISPTKSRSPHYVCLLFKSPASHPLFGLLVHVYKVCCC